MRALICSLDARGFLYSAVGLAQTLLARGHEVAIVTNIDHAEFLAKHGVERLPRGLHDGPSFQVAFWGEWKSVAIQVKHIEFALERFAADVIVGQALTCGPLIVASRKQLPIACLGLCTYLWPTADGISEPSEIAGWKRWRCDDMIKKLNSFRSIFGLPMYEGGCREIPFLADLFLLRSVPELEPAVADLPGRVHLVGSCLWEPHESDEELEEWCSDAVGNGKPLIYVQHGRSFDLPNFWLVLMEILKKMDCQVVASVDRMDSKVEPALCGSWIRPHVPQGVVLRWANLMVSGANTTAFLGAMSAGVPCLLLPGGGEQPDVAALAENAGVALTIPVKEVTPEKIETALRRLLTEESFRQKAELYRQAFARVDGFARAADLVEELERTRRPVLRPGVDAFFSGSGEPDPACAETCNRG